MILFSNYLGIGYIQSSISIVSEAIISNVTPSISSIYGGALMSIVGNGFSTNISDLRVLIGLTPCQIVQAQLSEIQCIIPPRDTNSDFVDIIVNSTMGLFSPLFYLNYSTTITPIVTSITASSSNTSVTLTINGNNFVVNKTNVRVGKYACTIISVTSTLIICIINNTNQSAGYHPVVVHVNMIGNSNSDILYNHTLTISNISPNEGSYGGGLPLTITGNGFAGNNVTVTICNRSCSSIRVISNTQLTCLTPNVSPTEVNDSCNVTVTVDHMSNYTQFTYRMNLTANVTSISPSRGGTGGGTSVTITGTNFP